MKRIIAFVKPNMLDDVIFGLHGLASFPGASASEVQELGRGSREHLARADRTPFHAFPKLVRLELVCHADHVEEIVETIRQNAHTGLPNDGKIYVCPVEDALRIRTGERGEGAV